MRSSIQLLLDGCCVCLNFVMDFADDFVVDDHVTFVFLKGVLLLISSGLEVILFIWITEFGLIEFFSNIFH